MTTIVDLTAAPAKNKTRDQKMNQLNLFGRMAPSGTVIRPFETSDLESLIQLIGETLPNEGIDADKFTANVLTDANFRAAGLLIAELDGVMSGFILSIAEPSNWDSTSGMPYRGFITLLGVAPDKQRLGIGSELISSAIEYLRQRGCSTVSVSAYPRGYFIPGIDVHLYPIAVDLILAAGFQIKNTSYAMECDLGQPLDADNLGHCTIRPFSAPLFEPLNTFILKEFPGDWHRVIGETVDQILAGNRPANSLLVAVDPGEIIGFAHWQDERFGPIGVRADTRGEKIGTALLQAGLDAMRRSGKKRAWFKWTDPRSAEKFYGPSGFAVTREFVILGRDL